MTRTLIRRLRKRISQALLSQPKRDTVASAPNDTKFFEQRISEIISRFEVSASNLLNNFHQRMDQVVSRQIASANDRFRAQQLVLRKETEGLRAAVLVDTPMNPCIHGYKVFAQTDEDGIIENILARIPGHSKTFIEIGCGNGLENNTHFLLLKGYRGCWIDGSADSIGFIEQGLAGRQFDELFVQQQFVDRDNVTKILIDLCDFIGTREPGVFSLDIDGNEYDVLTASLEKLQPSVICIEYNAKFPPPFVVAMRYDAKHTWAGDDYHGASLQALCNLLGDYKLVTCNLSGVNAFFVRKDHAAHFADYTAEQLYQPFREELIDLRTEHRPSLKWLRDKLHPHQSRS